MPSQRVSEEEIEFRKRARRRLVGAIFCVLVAVAVLPFVLASKPRPAAGKVAILVPPDTGAAQVAAPVAASDPNRSDQTAGAASSAAGAGTSPASDTPAPTPAARRYLVQVGTFADPAHARQLQSRLQAQGFHVFTDTVELATGAATRLRVGPYVSRAEALAAQQRLQSLHLGVLTAGAH